MPLHEFITLFIGISVFLSESVLCCVINSKCSVRLFSWTDGCVCVCVCVCIAWCLRAEH